MELKDKVVVVTGGGDGIGRQLVLEALRRGAWVAAVDIRSEALEETVAVAAAGNRLVTFVGDITDREAIAKLPGQVIETLGAVDVVINNAGIIQPFVKIADLEWEAIERVVNVNLYGTLNVNKAFLPVLAERPEAHLANVSSMGGYLPVPGQAVYGATKAAVKLLTEGLYAELLETGVGVSVIMPGAIATDISGNSGVEIASDRTVDESKYRTTPAEEAARIILDGIEAGKLHIYVGRDARLMNIANRVAPRRSTHLIQRQMKDLLT